MSPEHALHGRAFEHGIQLDKYLDADDVATLADQVTQYGRVTTPVTTEAKAEVKTVQVAFRKWARQLKPNEHLVP